MGIPTLRLGNCTCCNLFGGNGFVALVATVLDADVDGLFFAAPGIWHPLPQPAAVSARMHPASHRARQFIVGSPPSPRRMLPTIAPHGDHRAMNPQVSFPLNPES